jgi:hypothetical protein
MDAVPYREIAPDLSIHAYAGKAAGIVSGKLVICFFDHEQVCGRIGSDSERGGRHEVPVRGEPAQCSYRVGTVPGEMCGRA